MKKIIEIDETITRSYRIVVDEETAKKVEENNFFEPYTGELTLEDITCFHNKGELIREESNIDYAIMYDASIIGAHENDFSELYYSL